jgi:hypothetical protein
MRRRRWHGFEGDPDVIFEADPVARLIEIPYGKKGRHGPHVIATVTAQTVIASLPSPWSLNKVEVLETEMRNTFNIELKVDILSTDDGRKEAFVDLVLTAARMIYGQAAMLAGKRAPEMKVYSIGMDGKEYHDIFAGEEFVNNE